jgi:hypothetical protein
MAGLRAIVCLRRESRLYLGYHPFQIYFDLTGIGILLVIACCFCGFFMHALRFVYALRGKPSVMISLAVFALMLSVVQVYHGKMVPDAAWVVMLGAIENAPVSERARRIYDLRAHWQARSMRAVDWYVLSRKWNVCHDLWAERSCFRPAASEEAVGIARELLNEMAGHASSARTRPAPPR